MYFLFLPGYNRLMEIAVWDLKTQFKDYQGKNVFDCYIAEYLLSEGRSVPELSKVLEKYGAESLEELAEIQKVLLEQNKKLSSLFYDVEMPLVKVLKTMEERGILLDTKQLALVGKEIDKEVKSVENSIRKDLGAEININSPTQLGTYLVDKEGVPLAKTKTGKYATNEAELAKFQEQFPVIQKILTYRELTKLRSTYVDSLITKVDKKGRVHTTYSQVVVNTGRLSSSNPNLQNIPVNSIFGKKIKSCFVTDKDNIFVSFDYSQQELRILAHLTGEEKLITAFLEHLDVHKITASQLFSVSYDDVTKEQRAVGKTINFGIIYGMSSFGLSQGMRIPVAEADVFIKKFYQTYPKIQSFYETYFTKAKIDGYVETLFGRRRYVFEHQSSPFASRYARASEGQRKFIDKSTSRGLLNFPFQGPAAGLMKKGMIQLMEGVVEKENDVFLILQIHDDLVFEMKESDKKLDQTIQQIRDIMCTVYSLSVPIEVDVKIGKHWGDLEPYVFEAKT